MESVFLTIAREDEVAVAAASAKRAGRAAAGIEMKTLIPDAAAVDVSDYGTKSCGGGGNDAIAALRHRAEASGSGSGAWAQFTTHFVALGQKRIRLRAALSRWGCLFQFLIPIVVVPIGMALLSNSGQRATVG